MQAVQPVVSQDVYVRSSWIESDIYKWLNVSKV